MGLQLHTRVLSAGESIVLTSAQNVLYFSYQLSSGTSDSGTLTGTFPFKASNDVAAAASEAITIGPGGGAVFVTDPQRPMSLTLACVTGSLGVIIGF